MSQTYQYRNGVRYRILLTNNVEHEATFRYTGYFGPVFITDEGKRFAPTQTMFVFDLDTDSAVD